MNVIGDNFDDFDLLPGVTLIRDRAKIRKIINKDIKPFTGIIEYEHLYNANHIIFADLKDDFFQPSTKSNIALTTWLLWIDMLINTSWFLHKCDENCHKWLHIFYCLDLI